MKEAIRSNSMPKPELTSSSAFPRLGREGRFIMTGTGEVHAAQVLTNGEEINPVYGVINQKELKDTINSIKHPELKFFASSFQNKLRQASLSTWELGDLQRKYRTLQRIESSSEQEALRKGWNEDISSTVQAYRLAIDTELEARVKKGEITEEDFDAFKEQTKKDYPIVVKSLGARTRRGESGADINFDTLDPASYTEPELQEAAEEIKRMGGAGLVDNSYLGKLRERLRGDIQSGRVNPTNAGRFLRDVDQLIASASSGEVEEGAFGQRLLSTEEKQSLIKGTDEEVDEIFNRMLARVDASPRDHFNEGFGTVGNYEWDEFKKVLNEARNETPEYIRAKYGIGITPDIRSKVERRIRQYDEEMKMRQNLHNVNYAVINNVGTEEVSKAAQFFSAEHADLAFNKKGSTTAMHFYEQAMLKVMAENNGFLPPKEMIGYPEEITEEDEIKSTDSESEKQRKIDIFNQKMFGRVEYLARKYFQEALNKGLVKGVLKDGAGQQTMKKWEIDRAFSIARGMGIILGRTIEIAATSKLPSGGGRLMSLYAQDIIKDIAPFRHVVGKFEAGVEKARIFAFILNRDDKPWSKKELEEFSEDDLMAAINGLALEEDKERYLSVLNPLSIGGLLSWTGWRYGKDTAAQATGKLLAGDPYNQRIGTGLWIETQRGNLGKTDLYKDEHGNPKIEKIKIGGVEYEVHSDAEKSRIIIREALLTIARRQPLKLFFNHPDLQRRVLKRLKTEGVYSTSEPTLKMDDNILKNDLDQLVLLQEKSVLEDLSDLDFSMISDATQRARVGKVREYIFDEFTKGENGKTLINKFIGDLKDKTYKVPYILGAEDIPFDEFEWAKTGPTSIARRWRDIMGAKAASGGIGKLVGLMDKFEIHKPEDKEKAMDQIVVQLREIYDGVSNYDEKTARKVTMRMAEGVAKFFKKDWVYRVPGHGFVKTALEGGSSYAQVVFGREAMTWDELDMQQFALKLHNKGMLPHEHDEHGVSAFSTFKKRIGGGRKEVAYGLIRNATSLIALALLLYMIKETTKKGN